MPAKKVSRVMDVQKNNQLKYNFTGVPETDPRACFNRATWSPAVNLQQPPLGTSHLILGDSLVRVLSNLRTSWVTTVMAFGGATIAQLYRMVELMNPGKIPNVMILVGTNDISRGSDEQEALWEAMMVCLFTTLWQKFSCAVLTVCIVPMNTRSLTVSGRRHNEGVMRWNNILRNLANRNAGRMILMDIEHELRAMDQARLTTDGIHFDSVEGQAWLNRVFQERLDELEAELFDTGVLKEEGTVSDTVITTFVPPNLETRLGTVPAAINYRQQSSSEPGRRTDVQDRLGEAPMRRTIHPRRRIGPVNQPIEEVAGTSRSDTRSETTSTSREERPSRGSLMWSRSIPSPWHIYKEELMKLDLQRVSFIEDARRMLNGATLSVSRLYSITGVDWLIAASINFSSTTALRFADLEGLPSNNTIGPVNARPLQDVRLNHDERNREERPGRFLTARAPIGQHVKIFRQLTTPPGHVKERVYPKLVNQDGDAQRYGGLTAIKKDETIFAAYDKAEMRKAKIMVVANSEFVYTSKSLFWPDVIMLAAVDLDLLQSVSLAIGVQRQTEMNPITIVFAGINDHLHSRGFLSRLRDPATAENAVWPAIKDILESMGEVVDATKEGSFNKVTLRVVFALSPGYAYLPDGLKFVYAMVALLSEGKYDVIISAPNRMIEMENLRPLKAELPAVWSDISNAMRGFKDHALHMLVLDEVLGLELSNFSRQLKLKPGIDDDHRVITAMSNDLWFRAMEVASEDTRRKNSLETRANLEAMVLRTKPEANQWLHLNPRVAALGADAFQQGPVMITKIYAYLLKEVNLAENAGEKTAEFVNRMCQITLETFWTQEVKGQEGFERTDSMLEGLGAGWTASFLAKVYPKVSHYLIKEFLQAVVKVSIVELIALFVTFGAENFVKGPVILLTDGIQNLRLDGLLTLIAITHGNLGGLMKLARCPEQMKERVRNLDMKKSTDSWNKIRDLRHTLIQYLLQQNRFGTGEDETIEREEDVRRHVGGMPLLTDLSLAMRIDPLALIRGVTEFVTVIYGPAVTFAFPDVKVEAYRRSVLHLNLISAVDGSTLNWCEQHALRELMSEDLLFAKISEPEMTVINFDDHFCDRMREVERGHIEVFPKLWNLRPYDKTNGEMTRVPRLTAAYHKVREETKDWGDYKKLPEAIPEFPLIRRMLLGAVSVVQTPRLRAFETNERRVGNFSATMDPYFVGRNAAVLQYTRFAYTDQATRRRISNAATPKPEGFDEEWRGLGLAPMRMRGRTELPEASVILTSVRKEMKVAGILQTRIFLAPFGCEETKVVHGEEEDKSAGTLLIPRFQEEADDDKQGPSNSNGDKSEGDDGQGGNRQTEEPMQQDKAGGEDDRASTGGTSSLDFNIFSDLENNADTLETTEPADEGISTLEPPSAFEEMKRNLPESSSPGNTRNNDQRILMESPRRRRIEASARVPFLGTLPEEEWEVHHRDHESRTGCKLDRVAFMEEVWTVIQSYGTQSILKTGLNQPLMREVLDKLDECEGRLSELLIDSATDESEANSPIKMTPQDNEGEVVYLSRTRRGTDVNLVTALGFYSMFGSLESLLNLEQKHEMVTAISVEVFPGVLQTEQKYIGKWREAIETEMNIRHSETYCRPSGARYLVGSMLAPMCKSKYPVHFVAVDVKSTRTIVDQAFSVPKCVRLARMSEKSYELLCKIFSAVPERTKEELESILGKKFMGYVSGNFSDFEKQKQRGSTVTDYNAVDENDEIHRVMMEVEPLLEASGKQNWRSIMLTHDEFPCHCLLQTWWYPKRSNLVLIWDSGELLSMGLPDSSQPITIVIVGVMMAIRWLEAHVRENNRQEAPTKEQLQKLDCLKDLDLFETMCKVLNIPMEVKKIWARKRLMPWFRANMTAWLYEYAKKHMSKHGRVYSEYQLDIGAGAFKRAFVTHRNAVTTAVKRISRTSERSGNEKAEMLKEDLERNVTLCLHNSFCRNRESNVDPLPCCKQRVEQQKCWRTASNSVRIVNDVLQDTETESAESVSQEEEMEH